MVFIFISLLCSIFCHLDINISLKLYIALFKSGELLSFSGCLVYVSAEF
jgi:hypothetical protein